MLLITRCSRYMMLMSLFTLLVAACASHTAHADKAVVVVHNGVPGVFGELVAGFQAGMTDLGYRDGENITYIYTASGVELERALDQNVSAVISIPGTMAFISGAALGDVPVIFVPASDPVKQGLVASLSQPGGNATGIMQQDAVERRFQLLLDAVPGADLIYVVYDGGDPVSLEQTERVKTLATYLNVNVVLANSPLTDPVVTRQSMASIPPEADAIFMVQGHGAGLGVGWTDVAVQHGIPLSAIGMANLNSDYGPFMAYGPDMRAMGIQAARLTVQVLRGRSTAVLPVENADLYVMVDLRVADLIGLDVPRTILQQSERIYRTETDGKLPPLVAATEPTSQPAASTGACQAYETNPAGTNLVCATAACDQLLDSFVTYAERTEVTECTAEGVLGTCLTNDMAIHYYEGESTLLKMGCSFAGGEWIEPGT